MKTCWYRSTLAALFVITASGGLRSETAEENRFRLLISGLKLHELREDAETPELDVYGSYEEAQQLEAEIVQMYREIRAAELSLIQRQTLERSLESTLPPLSERAKVDRELLRGKAADAEGVKVYQEELGVVMRETDQIVAHARDLLNRFKNEQATPPPPEEMPMDPPTPEEIAAMAAAQAESPAARQEQQVTQPQRMQQQQAMLQQQVEQDIAEAEINLEEALEEIRDAKELVRLELKETAESIAELEQELAEAETPEPEKQEELEAEQEKSDERVELDRKIDAAEDVVQEVVEKIQRMAEVTGEQIENAEEVVKELREALAEVMAADAAADQAEQEAAQEHTEEAVAHVEAARQSMESAAEAMAEMAAITRMLAEMDGGEDLSAELAIAQQQSLGALARARSGLWLDITAQMRGRNLNAKPVETPPAQRPTLWEGMEALRSAPSARRVVSGSRQGGEWVFVGDWYVLSRYDNEHRANLQKVYPPESILDLNANYVSEDGQRMRWEYESFLPPTVIPYGWEPWKIYYFYTELFFEEEAEVWLAIGSDDRSDLWINDLPVWHSSNQHKNWRPGEGFRKVYFRKGRNKVLVRLENGHLGLGFSMFMNMPPPGSDR